MNLIPLLILSIALMSCSVRSDKKSDLNRHYITNQPPLKAQPYVALPLGSIKPKGMLLKMLELQRDGLTGQLDSIYSKKCGDNNAWLGGTGDGWSDGPYWLDGLVPLAYILDDHRLKEKAQRWIEWSLNNQRKDGYFGPQPLPEGYKFIPGVRQNLNEDWWSRIVMLKVLQQYYSATDDQRVINLMLDYFRFQKEMLPDFPLDHWSLWGSRRGADNLAVVYWLYNITKEKFLLELAEIIHQQTFNWTEVFSGNTIRRLNPLPDLHCVNVTQGLKAPVIYYQQHPEQKYLEAVKNGLSALQDCHGFVNGMFAGDERLHGNNPTQGSELCTAVEMMFSFESILPVTGDIYYADYLEKIAYNVLPAQINDDWSRRQYFQQVNQVLVTEGERNFFNDEKGRIIFGTTSGYDCCLLNMHQGWPKFVQNLWYATADNGIAALVYGPSEVTAKVANGEQIRISEKTEYPFGENIHFTINTDQNVRFPFHLRIPQWCNHPIIRLNGNIMEVNADNNIVIIDREWSSGDIVEVELNMELRFSYWFENSLGIERGPLVYALRIEEEWREITKEGYDDTFWEVFPKSPWNFAIIKTDIENKDIIIEIEKNIADFPWNPQNAPIRMIMPAKRFDRWQIGRGSAGNIPSPSKRKIEADPEDIVLIPYGCTTLRVAQFPFEYFHRFPIDNYRIENYRTSIKYLD